LAQSSAKDSDEESRIVEIENINAQISDEDGDEVEQSQESPAEILTFAPTPESPNEETGDNKV